MRRRAAAVALAVTLGLAALFTTQAARMAAGALLHPARQKPSVPPPPGCADLQLPASDVQLRGWRCPAHGERRGAIVYLHGIADNRASGRGVIERYRRRGFDMIAYDSRAHGESAGDVCTYGYYEKDDLRRVVDMLAPGPIVSVGASLGAAVALQHAATDNRISGVVAAEVFSDLRAVVRERAPFFLTNNTIETALRIAEQRGRFRVDAVSPVAAAKRIRVPVLLIHGAEDRDTAPAHSKRVHDALAGPKRLILVDGAAHNQSLSSGAIWSEIDQWIDAVIGAPPGAK